MPIEQHDQDPDRQAGDRQHDQQDDHHDHGRAEVGLEQHQHDRDPGHDQQAEDVAPGQALLVAARAVGRHGQDQREDGELGGLQLQRADAEPARRALGAAAHHEDAEQGEHDQPVEDHGQRFEPPVVEQGHHAPW